MEICLNVSDSIHAGRSDLDTKGEKSKITIKLLKNGIKCEKEK